MKKRAEELVVEMCRLFNLRAADGLVALFDTPLPIYSADGLRLRATLEDTKKSIQKLMRLAHAAGCVEVIYELESIETTRSGRQEKAQLVWKYLDAAGHVASQSRLIYYCGQNEDGDLRIQMVEYLSPAFPEVYAFVPPDKAGPRHH